MTILFLRSNPVSPDSRVEKEATALVRDGNKVMIFAWDRSCNHPIIEQEEVFNGCKVLVYRIGIQSTFGAGFRKNLLPLLKFQIAIYKFIHQYADKIDVIHACDFDTAGAAFLAKSKSKCFIYDIFDYYVDAFSVPTIARRWIEKADTYVMNRASAVIICTEERKKQLRYASPKKLIVIHNTPPKRSSCSTQIFSKEGKIKVVYVGILSYGRDILEVCDFISKHSQFELHIGGFGILEKDVTAYAEKFNNIIFYSKLSYEDTLRLEGHCDIFAAFYDPLISNHRFAAPNKFYESLMLGKPIAMASGSGMSNVVSDFDIGCVCDYKNPGKALITLAQRKADWSRMSRIEKILYEKNYSWSTMEKRLIGLYREIALEV